MEEDMITHYLNDSSFAIQPPQAGRDSTLENVVASQNTPNLGMHVDPDVDTFFVKIHARDLPAISPFVHTTGSFRTIRQAFHDNLTLQIADGPLIISVPLLTGLKEQLLLRCNYDPIQQLTLVPGINANVLTKNQATIVSEVLVRALENLGIVELFVAAYGVKLQIAEFERLVGRYAQPWTAEYKQYLVAEMLPSAMQKVDPRLITMASNVYQVGKSIPTNDAACYLFSIAGPNRLGTRRHHFPIMGTFGVRLATNTAKFGGVSFHYTSSAENVEVSENGITRRIIYTGPLFKTIRSMMGSKPPAIPLNNKANIALFHKCKETYDYLVQQFHSNSHRLSGYRLELEFCGTDVHNRAALGAELSLLHFAMCNNSFIFGLKVSLSEYLASLHALLKRAIELKVHEGRNDARDIKVKRDIVSTIVSQLGWSSKHCPTLTDSLYVSLISNADARRRALEAFRSNPDLNLETHDSDPTLDSANANLPSSDPENATRGPNAQLRTEILTSVIFRQHPKSREDNPLWTYTRLQPRGAMGVVSSRQEELADRIYDLYGPRYAEFVKVR